MRCFKTRPLWLLFLLGTACVPVKDEVKESQFSTVPNWAQEAIWYQIFPERFYNGDTLNDPRPEDMVGSYPGFVPEGWQLTPWTWEWHRIEPWLQGLDTAVDLAGNRMSHFGQKVQLRRYGGDLAGVMAKLDYLDSLGVTALYFNPLNDAPSLHKYDARNWRHIDRNFGPRPSLDAEIIASEDPENPSTWKFTSADSLFIEIIQAVHNRGMRLILDYSFNHTGTQFWAWQDLLTNQEKSPFSDWYWTKAWDDPSTDSNEFFYQGWLGVPSLPEIKDTPYVDHRKVVKAFEGGIKSAAVKQHIFALCQRWIDPNGDGNLEDGVDGFRLDVAAEMPLGWWRDFRSEMRQMNPDLYLIGEVWWEEYPNKLIDPEPYLKGDIFDAVMNYRWFRSLRHYIAAAPDSLEVTALIRQLQVQYQSADEPHQRALMNMSASHDAPRLSTALFNRNPYKQGVSRDNFLYKIHKPDSATLIRQKLFLALQFTMPGAPQIYNGDEMGMWGEDDPSNRKPIIWPEFEFEPEENYPWIKDARSDRPQFDTTLFQFYQGLIQLRKQIPAFAWGSIHFDESAAKKGLLVFVRQFKGESWQVVCNASNRAIIYPVELSPHFSFGKGYQANQVLGQTLLIFRLH